MIGDLIFERVVARANEGGFPIGIAGVIEIDRLLTEERMNAIKRGLGYRNEAAARREIAGQGGSAGTDGGLNATDHARVLHGDGAVTR